MKVASIIGFMEHDAWVFLLLSTQLALGTCFSRAYLIVVVAVIITAILVIVTIAIAVRSALASIHNPILTLPDKRSH